MGRWSQQGSAHMPHRLSTQVSELGLFCVYKIRQDGRVGSGGAWLCRVQLGPPDCTTRASLPPSSQPHTCREGLVKFKAMDTREGSGTPADSLQVAAEPHGGGRGPTQPEGSRPPR